MGNRRMFSNVIIDTDEFLDMPPTTQNLYFHLGMRGDDDGFVSNPKTIMRTINAAEDDMKILIAKRFIIPFQKGIVVIRHWGIHNFIRKDRYKETEYIKEKNSLELKNGKYEPKGFLGQPKDNQRDTQVKLSKVKLSKVNKDRQKKKEKYFVLKDYLEEMDKNKSRHIQIISLYFKFKDFKFENVEQIRSAIKRCVKPARELSGYPNDRILRAMKYCDNMRDRDGKKIKFTVETICKVIDENFMKLNNPNV